MDSRRFTLVGIAVLAVFLIAVRTVEPRGALDDTPLSAGESRREAVAGNWDIEYVDYGKYISNAVYHCYSCHSADLKTNDDLNPENSVGLYGGGNKLLDMEGNPMYSVNITMDKETGIGNWSVEDFVQAVKFGKRPDGTAIMYPMAKFSLLEDEEVKAIWAYLKTVPVISNGVKN